MDLTADVVVFEEGDRGEDRNWILLVVDASGRHLQRVEVVCESLVADLQGRISESVSTDTCTLQRDYLTRGEAYPR